MAAADIDDCSVMEKSSSSFSRLPPTLSPSEFWNRVEDVTREIIELVHPTLVSEDRRRNVIDYMQRLIKMTLGCEVHSFDKKKNILCLMFLLHWLMFALTSRSYVREIVYV